MTLIDKLGPPCYRYAADLRSTGTSVLNVFCRGAVGVLGFLSLVPVRLSFDHVPTCGCNDRSRFHHGACTSKFFFFFFSCLFSPPRDGSFALFSGCTWLIIHTTGQQIVFTLFFFALFLSCCMKTMSSRRRWLGVLLTYALSVKGFSWENNV